MRRYIRHLIHDFWSLGRHFPAHVLAHIEQAITEQERTHDGELRFAVEAALSLSDLWHDVGSRARAIDVFSRLRVWDTERNSGVLVYLLLADARVEIVADRGISAKVPAAQWEAICHSMEARFREGQFENGVIEGLRAISALLTQHFPPVGDNPNELSNRPVVL